MSTELLAHIFVPLVSALIIFLWRASVRPEPIDWKDCNEIAIEVVILSLGATGAIFINSEIIARFQPNTSLYGILVVLFDIAMAGVLIVRGRQHQHRKGLAAPAINAKDGILDLFLGGVCLLLTVGLIIKGLWR